MKPQTTSPSQNDLWLWIPALLGFGVAFYFSFQENFLTNFALIFILFVAAILLFYFNRDSRRSLIFIACATFLLGGFYANFYEKTFLNHTKISGKIYVDVVGKVESIKKFYNSVNRLEGANLVVLEPEMYEAKFAKKVVKKKIKKKKAVKRKILKRVQNDGLFGHPQLPTRHPELVSGSTAKPKSKKKISAKKIEKDFVNLAGYQEIDREFLDYSKNYQHVEWLEIKGRKQFPNPPQKISVNLVKNFSEISVNDKIAFSAVLQPPPSKEFPDDFDFSLDAKMKKIGAFGFAIGAAEILEKARISSLDDWFLNLREKIRGKILSNLKGDSAAITLAFLIGDQTQISAELMAKIRNSGLAHLLSISGFHLSLAGAIFFITTRFLLSRSEYLALHFNLKKIAAVTAIFATYFYLKIAASPLPAQRAFLMVFLVLLALFFDEKINAKRAIMTVVLTLILANPYVVFNISFQLSFAAILTMGIFYEKFNRDFFPQFLRYFIEVILLSILIQIATLPFLMHSFQNLAVLGFISNILAIPLTSFLIMPCGFLSFFLMPLGAEKYVLFLMQEGIFLLERIINFVADLNYSHVISPILPSLGLGIAIFGFLVFCLLQSNFRFLGIAIFLLSFLTISFAKKPQIIFEKNQKFFAIYDENGLTFSKKLKPSRQRNHWMKRFGETEFKILKNCEKDFCLIEKNQKILVLLQRNQISEICKNDFDVIVNLTRKYQLPQCVAADKIKIDNFDFYEKGTQFLFFENQKFDAQKIYTSGETKRDEEGNFWNDSHDADGDF